MTYKITKLDRRHNGFTFYKYSISPNTVDQIKGSELLVQLRNWCWATFGPSAELGFTRRGSIWAWDTEHGNKRIYLQSDAELVLFNLKWQ